jgi:hypothetical protein
MLSAAAASFFSTYAKGVRMISKNNSVNCRHLYFRRVFLTASIIAIVALLSWSEHVVEAECNGCPVPTFETAITTAVAGTTHDGPAYPQHLTVGDFNNDGKADLVVRGADTLAMLLGDGLGGFSTQITTPNSGNLDGLSYLGLAAADFNDDGNLDLVSSAESSVSIYHGDGTGHFGPAYVYGLVDHNGWAYDLAVGDFNHDDKPDVATLNSCCGVIPVTVLFGDGFGVGGGHYNIDGLAASQWYGIAVADFNGDNHLDILFDDAESKIVFGDGAGHFSEPTGLSIPNSAGNLHLGANPYTVADFNGDGKIDVATPLITVHIGDGMGGFAPTSSYEAEGFRNLATADINGDGRFDLVMASATTISVLLGDGSGGFGPLTTVTVGNGHHLALADLNGDGKVDLVKLNQTHNGSSSLSVLLNSTYQTPVGENSTVVVNNTSFTFDEVTSGGTTTVTPIDPASVGEVPGGFAVSDSVAYEIATTATFTGSVTLAFKVPGPISEEDFNNLAILHNENGTLVDVTATTPARDYANLTIYATTTSFSPFYLARKGPHIKTLFDQTKAYKSGSTIPIKLQVFNASNSNVSSSNTSLITRDLRLLSGNTLAPIEDSGNANPDYTFRYDATLGGSGGGYIFNLSTKGLASGQYVLSFYIGSERSFFYTVKFEVK